MRRSAAAHASALAHAGWTVSCRGRSRLPASGTRLGGRLRMNGAYRSSWRRFQESRTRLLLASTRGMTSAICWGDTSVPWLMAQRPGAEGVVNPRARVGDSPPAPLPHQCMGNRDHIVAELQRGVALRTTIIASSEAESS